MNRLYSATPDGYCGDEDNGNDIRIEFMMHTKPNYNRAALNK
jgi:hypothetical protein